MKKEYLVGFVIAIFLLSLVLDSLAGPLRPTFESPYDFFKPEIISIYPFTAVSIGLKTIFIFVTLLLTFSLVEKKYVAKGILLLFCAALLELYSIQQVATGSRMVPLEWSLAFAWSGVALLLPTVVFFLLSVVKTVHKKLSQTTETNLDNGEQN